MSKLYFKVASDWQEVVRLRNEISKLEAQIKSMDANKAPQAVAVLNHQMQQTKQQMQGMITEAAKAGAVMENDFKSKIYQGSQAVNDFTQKIINQKAVVKDVEADVRRLGESYRSALKSNPLSASSKLSEYTSAKKVLDEEKASLFGLTQQQANAHLSVKKLRDEYALYKDEGKGVVNTTDGIGISLKKAFAVIGGVAVIKQLGSEIIRVRGEFQSMQTAIETLVGKDMAGNLIPQIKELAKVSPLTLTDMVGAEKMMLGFNIKAEDTIRYLQALGDISMGNSQKFNSLTLAFSQTSAAGKLMGQDLNQMINAGFNPLQQISLTTGKSIAQLKDEMSKGAISAEMVQKAFVDATSAGGKFFGMSENASKTINGQISMMQDAMDEALNEMGQKSEGVIMSGIQLTTKLVENYETVGKILSGLVITYGAYRTALIANIALTRSWAVATRVDAVAKGIQTIATKAQAVAQLALNSAMKANPYVLLATAVVGAATAMWAFHDGTTAAEKAQDSYNKKVEDAVQKTQDHKQKLEGLISELQNEVTAETRKMEILDEIKKGYPSLFQKFIDEKGHIKDLTEAWKAYNEEASKNKAFQNKDNVNGLKESISEQKRFLELFDMGINDRQKSISSSPSDKTIWNKYNGKGTLNIKKDIEVGERELWKWEKDVRDDEFTQWKVDLKGKTDEQIKAIREAMVSRSKSAKGDKNLLSALGKRIIALDDESNSRKPLNETQNKSYWETQKKDAQSQLEALTDIEAAGKKGATLKDQINDYDNKINAFSASKTSSQEKKEESAAEKLRKQNEKLKELSSKQSIEQERTEENLQNQVAQSRIDAMKDGSTKTIAQMQLNHKKEMQQFEREKEDKLRKAIEDARAIFDAEEDAKKAKNPKHIKGTFDASGVKLSDSDAKQYDTQKGFIGEKQKRETEEYYKSLRDSYQDYTDQRIAIEEKFNAEIATLQEARKKYEQEGNTEKVQQTDRAIAQATKDKGQGLMQLDYDKLKESPEYVCAFENLKQTSSETLKSLLSQLENAKHTAAKVLSPDQLREYTTTIQEIMDELDARNPWQALSDKKQELADAEQELAQAQIELENARQTAEAVKGGAKIESGVSSSKYNSKTGKIDSTKAYLTEAQALDKVKVKTDNYNKSKDKVAEKSAKVKKSEKDVTDQIDELSKAISDVGNSIGGPAGEIISLIGDIGSFTMMAINGVKMAADTSAQAISTVEKASVILMIISAAIQLATKVMSFFAADYSDYNESKENYEKYVEVLDVIISKQKELIETLTGKEAVKASKDALDLIEKQAQAARNLGKERLNAGASAGSHSIGVRIKDSMSESGWNEALNAIGASDYNKVKDGRMTGLFDLSVQQLTKLQMEAPEFWAKLDEDVREYLEQIIACNENAEELKGILNESLTGITFDSVSENFLDALSDMDTSAADFADNFSSYMQKAILNTMMAKTYEKRLNDWYESFANANKDGDIDSLDYDKLQKDWGNIVSDALLDRDKLKDLFGWTSGESISLDSTSGGFETMSQDTGEELNGRFTALQISNEEIKNQNILQSQSLNLLTFKADAILSVNTEVRNIADETRTLIANSYLELQEIRENTGAIVKPIIQMQKDIAEVKKNTSKF